MNFRRMTKTFTAGALMTILSAFAQSHQPADLKIRLPYQKAGLSERQAAAHLLSRFSFGPRPGEVDEVVKMGLEKWLQQQLDGKLPEDEVARRLTGYEALALNNETIANTYLNAGQIIRMAAKNNILDKDSIKSLDKPEYRAQLKQLMDQQGLKAPQELQRQLVNQKIIRAAYGQNQLHEILADFWFNHFNVSLTKNQSQQFVMTYERDAIRPNVLGNFETMLEATAKHPAMLEYLDNASSISNENELSRKQANNAFARRTQDRMEVMAEDTGKPGAKLMKQALKAKKAQGLNENYAREVMELHTLGVDGGYTQHDVTEVARALTGWSVRPLYKDGPGRKLYENNIQRMEKNGFVTDGDFLYRADKHDENEKTILGRKFAFGGGYYEGIDVLKMLANHPSTAKFISTKLATRFVADTPSITLVNRMAEAYLQSKGNIKAVIITMVNSPEFWSKTALREKVKSPFEFAISAIRATNADVQQPFQIYTWCMKMGQRFYYYQAPTGFPDRATYWINTGSLLSRMNFGLAFATQKIPGIKINLAALNDNHEPESAEAALVVYSRIFLPERNQEDNIKRLTALVHDANLEQKISAAAVKNPSATTDAMEMNTDPDNNMAGNGNRNNRQNVKAALNKKNSKPLSTEYVAGNTNTVSQVAGIILGSPEFQRK